ncbi:hypothetical protein Ddye_013372 [Dipteronia dyeriana]|uniref:DUF1985 domain-containing protein n=1 Tax=Dipteronia dyeriana TaxID=168575 RepID=A0AAE0CJK3_9ROSI|nr:hypothetical protein Ddye_013372 [Dipteronia dyeriana]
MEEATSFSLFQERMKSKSEIDGKLIDGELIGTRVYENSCDGQRIKLLDESLMRNRLRDLLKTPQGDWYEGKLTRHNHFDSLAHIDDALNWVPAEFADENRHRFMASCFGHFLTMYLKMKFSGGVIHRLLLREVHHNGPTDEMQFMLGNQSVRFSKVKFFLISGLRFGVVPDTTKYAEVENGIHQRYLLGADEVSLEKIRGVVTVAEFGEAYDAVKLCLIYMLNWILIGVDKRFKIPVLQFRLVEDLDAFKFFPWGAHVYWQSIYSFKHAFDGRRDGFERRQWEKDAHGYGSVSPYFEMGVYQTTEREEAGQDFQSQVESQAPYYTGLNEGRSLYVEEDRLHIPSPVPDQTIFSWNSGTKGGGLTDRTSDNEGSKPDVGGLKPSDSEGY